MNENEDPGLLSDDELEARQRAADSEAAGHNPEVGKQATDDADPDVAPDATNGEAPASDAPAKTTPDSADAAAAPAAGADAAATTGKPEGVLSKDGTRVLPYSALQAERRAARSATARAQRLEQELTAAQQAIADMKAGKAPDVTEMTEADVAEMEENFPEQGKKLRALFEKAQAASPSAPANASTDDEPGDDPVQEAIDQVPLLLDWQHGDAEKFARAQEIDAVLVKSPKWQAKPAVDRFNEVARIVADEYDIPFTDPKSSTTATKTAAPAVQRRQPETLSDFKGGALPDHGSVDVARASPQQLLNRMEGWTDEQIDAHLAKYG